MFLLPISVSMFRECNQTYFESWLGKTKINSLRNKNRLEQVLKLKKHGNLLEIGCGRGEFLSIARKYFNTEGIDRSNFAVASIKKNLICDRVYEEKIENVKLDSNHYDVVIAYNILEHLADPEKTIRKIYDSLKKGGVLVGSVPNNSGLIGTFFTQVVNFFDKTHCSTFPPKEWKELYKKIQFGSIHFFGEFVLTKNFSLYFNFPAWHYISHNLMFVCQKTDIL